MSNSPTIVWLRHDLRTRDHQALTAAAKRGEPVFCVFILERNKARHYGAASRWWLHQSLAALASQLSELGGQLILRRGDPVKELASLIDKVGAGALYCSRQYEPHEISLEQNIHELCGNKAAEMKRYGGYLLLEPEQISSKTGTPYKVFTPFWRTCSERLQPRRPLPTPKNIKWGPKQASDELKSWGLEPNTPDWAEAFKEDWSAGELSAAKKLKVFLQGAINQYKEGRDTPSEALTSKLSPHLHFGEISPNTIVYSVAQARNKLNDKDRLCFLSEIGWREFSHHLLFHFPHLPTKPFNPKFAKFSWKKNQKHLREWQQGQTGIPLVDAGMRELWQTGWMHNRVRMIVASFLVKNLRIHWQEGEAWFWDTLLDANEANNCAGWQWVAGSGADAAPYFRIFNPVSQSQRFDSEGEYIKKWIPELSGLPKKHIHSPWLAPDEILNAAGVTLGKDYPKPLVDLKETRKLALDAYAKIK